MLSQLPTGRRTKTLIAACTIAMDSRPAKTPLFEMRNVTFRVPYHEDLWIFDDMNFRIDPGEFVIMLGSNGSGKSTGKFLLARFHVYYSSSSNSTTGFLICFLFF